MALAVSVLQTFGLTIVIGSVGVITAAAVVYRLFTNKD